MSRLWIWRSLAVSITVAWLASLGEHAGGYWNGGGLIWVYGLDIFLVGWAGAAQGQFAWYANVLVWFAVVGLMRREPPGRQYSWITGALLVALAGNALMWTSYEEFEIARFGLGHHIWSAAVVMSGLALVLRATIERRYL